jgi:hypothetical protein
MLRWARVIRAGAHAASIAVVDAVVAQIVKVHRNDAAAAAAALLNAGIADDSQAKRVMNLVRDDTPLRDACRQVYRRRGAGSHFFLSELTISAVQALTCALETLHDRMEAGVQELQECEIDVLAALKPLMVLPRPGTA